MDDCKRLFNSRRHFTIRTGLLLKFIAEVGSPPWADPWPLVLDVEGTKVWGVLLGLGTLYSIWTIYANTLHYLQYPKSIRTETM